jgi:hypothetical protein
MSRINAMPARPRCRSSSTHPPTCWPRRGKAAAARTNLLAKVSQQLKLHASTCWPRRGKAAAARTNLLAKVSQQLKLHASTCWPRRGKARPHHHASNIHARDGSCALTFVAQDTMSKNGPSRSVAALDHLQPRAPRRGESTLLHFTSPLANSHWWTS